jgi:Na+/H+-dicarboxylate symporter
VTRQPRRISRLSLIQRICIAIAAGLAIGVFFGERAAVLDPVADGFVQLLQMAVLPYLTVSVIATIGSLSVEQLKRLGVRLALVLAGIWSVTFGFAFLLVLMLPEARGGAFFSTTLVERPPPIDFIDLYIPANPFFALANNIVPGVVMFSIAVGAALIGLPRKQALIDMLVIASEALGRVMRFVTTLMPYGVFAIVATAAGTLRIDEASRLQIYLSAYAMLSLLIALWVLPGLVSTLTPIPARAMFAATREGLITAAVAGDLFVVLPLLVAGCRDLMKQYLPSHEGAPTVPEALVPIAYNFPHGGKVLTVSFIVFAGWFANAPIDVMEYPSLAIASLVTFFGSMNAAVPVLLDLFRVPADMFQLYIATGVINSRFGGLVAATHMVAVALIGSCAVVGALRWQPARIATFVAATAALTAVVVIGTRTIAESLYLQSSSTAAVLDQMRVNRLVPEELIPAPIALTPAPETGSRIEAITAARTLRVGYLADALPFAFLDSAGALSGLDVALAHHLAKALDVRLQFVPLPRTALDDPAGVAAALQRGECDMVIGGIAVTTSRARLMALSTSYMQETLGFVVRDDMRRQFESWDAIRARPSLSIAVPSVPYFVEMLQRRLPGATLREMSTARELFETRDGIDAIAMPAERGSAWTLRHPQYTVVVPAPAVIEVPLAFALPRGEPRLAALVNTWIELMRRDGTTTALYEYWILGRTESSRAPRWSIIRDVLGWLP